MIDKVYEYPHAYISKNIKTNKYSCIICLRPTGQNLNNYEEAVHHLETDHNFEITPIFPERKESHE